jgi:hypothetical protein
MHLKHLFGPCVIAMAIMGQALGAPPAGPYIETQRITPDNPAPLEDLGFSVAANDGLLIAGAINSRDGLGNDVGSAYVYRQMSDGTWDYVARLRPADGGHNDAFGWSVGIDDDFAIVGAWGHEHASSGDGAAYIFHRTTDADWQQVAEFPAPADSDNFSYYTDMDGAQAVVSGSQRINLGPGPRGDRGFVNIFEQSGATTWQHTQRIDVGSQLSRVHDVAIDDGTLVLGASYRTQQFGPSTYAVEIYEDNGVGFTLVDVLPAPAQPQDAWFGFSVDIDQDRLLVGSPREATHGGAYIYERDANGDWNQAARLVASNFSERYHFGSQVALLGDIALVNSWVGPGTIYDGVVYVFQRDDAGQWIETDILPAPNGYGSFGWSVAIFEEQLLMGSGVNVPGAVHVFSRVPEPTSGLYAVWLGTLVALGCRLGAGWREGVSGRA